MAKDSRIEWTQHTFNPWWGCTKVSPGCKYCYAETWAKRIGQDVWGPKAKRRDLSESYWRQPLRWNDEATPGVGQRPRVFCASMADVFEERSELDPKRERLWSLIEATPNLDWLLLTKRPQNVARLAPWKSEWPQNVWLGATAENQRWLEKRLPHLLSHRVGVRFLSCEPLLGPLNLRTAIHQSGHKGEQIHWVIGGGESGHHARSMHPEWITSLRDQCIDLDVRFHFKQWGNWRPVSPQKVNGYRSKTVFTSDGNRIWLANMGKKDAGRRLQGRTWDEYPASVINKNRTPA